jgi:hypothetical protein
VGIGVSRRPKSQSRMLAILCAGSGDCPSSHLESKRTEKRKGGSPSHPLCFLLCRPDISVTPACPGLKGMRLLDSLRIKTHPSHWLSTIPASFCSLGALVDGSWVWR